MPIIIIIFFCFINLSYASSHLSISCPDTGEAITTPSPISLNDLFNDVNNIKDSENNKIIEVTDLPAQAGKLKDELADIFTSTKTKMGQFYWMLYIIHKHAYKSNEIIINGEYIKKILITSGVFKDDKFPNNINMVYLSKINNLSYYKVVFKEPDTQITLNNGEGFYSFIDGKCQHLTHLKFYSDFSFSLKAKSNNNLVVDNFKNVDFIGDFGAKGRLINIDLNYVSLRRVEFIYGTTRGKVTAKISDEEFKINKHNFLLKLVNKFVSNTTDQPIDW